MKMTKASVAVAALLAATAAAAAPAPDASSAWQTGVLGAVHLASRMKASAAATFRGNGDVDGSANMFPCPMPPIGPHGPIGDGSGSISGSANVSGDIAVASDDGKSHGTIHVSGVVWLDGFCSEGQPGLVSGIGSVTGSGPVYGADGKLLGTLKVDGSVSVSGSAYNVSGTADIKGAL